MVTLIATVLGAVIAMLAQITQDDLRARAWKRRKDDLSKAAVRVIRFHFFAAQHAGSSAKSRRRVPLPDGHLLSWSLILAAGARRISGTSAYLALALI